MIRGILALTFFGVASANGADWPQWGGQQSRNMASTTEKGLPNWFDCGKENATYEVDMATAKNVKWAVKVNGRTLGSPIVSNGKVFIGTSSSGACLLCLDEQTGRELGRFVCPKPQNEQDVRHCLEDWGMSSTPTVDEGRIYFVSPYQEVYCLDLKTWLSQDENRPAHGDQSPAAGDKILPNAQVTPEKCVLWKYDLARELKAVQQHTASCSVLVHDKFVYVCTGNGRWMSASANVPYYPLTPSLVVLNKKTGELVARDDEQIGERLWRGQWSSPSMGVVGKKKQIYFGAGDGTCYAFEPVSPDTQVAPNRWLTTTLRGPIIQFIDVSGTTKTNSSASPSPMDGKVQATAAPAISPARPTPASLFPVETRPSIKLPDCSPLDALPTAQVPDVPALRKIWWFDCIPKEYRKTPFYASDARSDGAGRPCEIMATPVFYRIRVYVAIGGDPNHGGRNSKGNLVCIDATKTGDITHTGQIWHYDKLNQSSSTVAIADGLVYALDESGVVHCLDAETGKCYWTYTVVKGSGATSLSPLVADGKLFIGKSILAAGKELKPLTFEMITTPSYSTPCVANGVLFTVQGKWLCAICDKGDKPVLTGISQ